MTVRVMSVVPSSYCAPESTSSSWFLAIRRLLVLVDFGQLAARRGLFVEPGQKARDGDAVAPMGAAAADDLGVVLGRFQERDRVRSALRLAAVAEEDLREGIRRTRLVDADGLAL
jgi:hypothetical protein